MKTPLQERKRSQEEFRGSAEDETNCWTGLLNKENEFLSL